MQKFYPDTVHRLMHGEVTRLQTPQRLRDAPYPLVRVPPRLEPPPPDKRGGVDPAHASAVQAEQAWNRRYKERNLANGRVATVKVRARERGRALFSLLFARARARRGPRARARPR